MKSSFSSNLNALMFLATSQVSLSVTLLNNSLPPGLSYYLIIFHDYFSPQDRHYNFSFYLPPFIRCPVCFRVKVFCFYSPFLFHIYNYQVGILPFFPSLVLYFEYSSRIY
ncbi:109aa long hypothetical protein [Pyrococcus horikoshii OT3]|uniref:Uncharacterized protein n=1 Tax=Pyrococcus horikoshii (strain ATCC 700860 / DSM 12428 / JCM 9974 / NBRC 100139 / OT-3) TaxID=70601 RepID=O57739_PYRHO|nr:109aa long hypothetical protein [Pyrococcus horikoshii OT3]